MNKADAIKLLSDEGWTKADADRALEIIDFKINPDELTIRRAISLFSGAELSQRQRLQAAQKGMVTKKINELQRKEKEYAVKLEKYQGDQNQGNGTLEVKIQALETQNQELVRANDWLKKDNKDLKNLVDSIKLRLAIDMKKLLQYEDSEIRRALAKWFKGTQG